MTAPPWWSHADRAELRLLIDEFCDGEREHRQRCPICMKGGPWCQPLTDALEIVLDWRERRLARSFAIALRARHDLLDRKQAA